MDRCELFELGLVDIWAHLDWDGEHSFESLSAYDKAVCRWCDEPFVRHPDWPLRRQRLVRELEDLGEL